VVLPVFNGLNVLVLHDFLDEGLAVVQQQLQFCIPLKKLKPGLRNDLNGLLLPRLDQLVGPLRVLDVALNAFAQRIFQIVALQVDLPHFGIAQHCPQKLFLQIDDADD